MDAKKVLFVVTSHRELGNTGNPTGYWCSEVSHPWKVLTEAGFEVEFVSPKGGECPVTGFDEKDPVDQAFTQDAKVQDKIRHTMKPEEVQPEKYAAIFYAGGHGVMWDFPDNTALADICRAIYEKGGVVSAVCHGPAGIVNVKLSNGEYLVKDHKINCFTDSEETAINLQNVVPFMLETELRKHGALFECSDNFQSHVVVNDRIITGQNPMSAFAVAKAIVVALS